MSTSTGQARERSEALLLHDYSRVTERPGQRASAQQLSMMAARYGWAARFCQDKDVLEVACGAGMGLSLLAGVARSVTAGDVDEANMQAAREAYRDDPGITLQSFDALDMPFADDSFDVVMLFEAIYYLPNVDNVLAEARRVLRTGGRLLIVSVNREWQGFNPSPFSNHYLSGRELYDRLTAAGLHPDIQIAFPERESYTTALIAAIRRVAVGFNLIPNTQAGKQLLKRLFYGRLEAVPDRLSLHQSIPAPDNLTPFDQCPDVSAYRVLYASASKTI